MAVPAEGTTSLPSDAGGRYLWGYWNGSAFYAVRAPDIFKPMPASGLSWPLGVVAGTGVTVWTPASGKKFRLMGFEISVSAAAALYFCDNAVGTVIWRTGILQANARISFGPADLGNGILSSAADNVLKVDASANVDITGTVWGVEE